MRAARGVRGVGDAWNRPEVSVLAVETKAGSILDRESCMKL